jgi:hypothetical protein
VFREVVEAELQPLTPATYFRKVAAAADCFVHGTVPGMDCETLGLCLQSRRLYCRGVGQYSSKPRFASCT